MKTQKLVKYLAPAIALFLAIIVLFACTNADNEIFKSIHISRSASVFCLVLSSFGGFLPPLIPVFAGFLMIFTSNKESKVGYIFGIIIGALFAAFFTWFGWQEGHIVVVHHKTLFAVLIAVFLFLADCLLAYLAHKLSKVEDKKTLFIGSIVIIVICFMSICGTEGVKLIVSRPRPIQKLLDIGEYRNWYEFKPFQKIKHENWDSFVSGHTSNSACLITTLPLLISLTKLRTNKFIYILGSIIGFLFTLVVATSRVLLMEHYMCDVAGSVIVSTVVQLLTLLITIEVIMKKKRL